MCTPSAPKIKATPPPAPPAPTAPDVTEKSALESAAVSSASDDRKRKGTASLRIDRTIASTGRSTGLNIPTA